MTRRKAALLADESSDDPQLVDACRCGDRNALGRVFASEAPALQRLIAHLVGPGPDVEDLLQTTLIAAVAGFPRFRGEAAIRTWLMGIAIRVVRQELQRPERRRRVPLDVVRIEEPADEVPPDRRVDARRRLERIYHHLGSVGAPQRIAFVLHVVEGRPIDEVAALMNASRTATKSRVFWARLRLMRRLRADRAFDPDDEGGSS